MMIPAGFFRGAGIPQGPRSTVYVECGCCGAFHREDFRGDCREDRERFAEPGPDATEIRDLEEGR